MIELEMTPDVFEEITDNYCLCPGKGIRDGVKNTVWVEGRRYGIVSCRECSGTLWMVKLGNVTKVPEEESGGHGDGEL